MDTEANERSSSTFAPLGLSLLREKGRYSHRKLRWAISVTVRRKHEETIQKKNQKTFNVLSQVLMFALSDNMSFQTPPPVMTLHYHQMD